jgi:REP element-mobilizing transposase RayT/CheY-like chemotaxis protein
MRISVLVVTPTPGFGALIQQTLEESGRYQVTLTDRPDEAVSRAGSIVFNLCILDLSEEAVASGEGEREETSPAVAMSDLSKLLRERLPALRVVIVPPENNPESPAAAASAADGTLTKPFYLPDLLDTLDEVLQPRPAGMGSVAPARPAEAAETGVQPGQPAPSADRPEAPAWLVDVSRAARHLARLSMEAAAQAALIVSNGELWAYAGELPQQAAQELAGTVAHHWARGGSSDLARFIRLDTTQSEYMLYATRLGGEMVLALVFDVETPFSKIRSQASRLAHALSTPPTSEETGLPAINGEQAPSENAFPQEVGEDQVAIHLPPLFDDVPPPSPLGWGSGPASSMPTQQNNYTEGAGAEVDEAQFPEVDEPVPDPLADTRPMPVSQPGSKRLPAAPAAAPAWTASFEDWQSASAAVCNLNYACMLIPRLPQHHLTGDLAVRLPEWVTQLSLAFGWRLEHMAVRPDYMLWVVKVTPAVSPSFLVRLMRQHTSQRIFAHFPGLVEENPSGDFWAPGYLVMSSAQPPPGTVMQDFIQQTRRRQGAV